MTDRVGRRRWLQQLDLAGIAALVALLLYQSLFGLQVELRFTADSERDLFYVLGLSHHGIMPADGIRMAALGLDLGPLYFLLVAPLNMLWPSPQTIHVFNTLVCAAGVTVFALWVRGAWGRAAALIGGLLYVLSGAHGALVDTVWHVGATPGVALAMLAAMGRWFQTGSRKALWAGGVLLAVLMQLHALGVVYAPAALALLIAGRRHLDRRAVLGLVVATTIALSLLLFYGVTSLFDASEGAARHSGGFSFRPGDFARGLRALSQPRMLLAPGWTGLFVALLVLGGIIGTGVRFRRAGDPSSRPWFRAFLIAQLAVGALVVSTVLPYENVGRYYLPVTFPFFALAAAGIGEVDALLRSRGRTVLGRGLTFAVIVAGLALVGGPTAPSGGAAEELAEQDYLSLEEQELVVDYLVRHEGMTWARMRGRVHGAFFGPLSGIRYLEAVARPSRGAPATGSIDDHFMVLPDGFAAAWKPAEVLAHVPLQGRARVLHLYRYRPRFGPQDVRSMPGDQPCPWPFPFLWSEAPAELLVRAGFPLGHGPDIHRCLRGEKGGTLAVRVRPNARQLTLQLSDDGHFRPNGQSAEPALQAWLEAEGQPRIPVALTAMPYAEKAWYRIHLPPHDGWRELHLVLRPRGHLGFIDLF